MFSQPEYCFPVRYGFVEYLSDDGFGLASKVYMFRTGENATFYANFLWIGRNGNPAFSTVLLLS